MARNELIKMLAQLDEHQISHAFASKTEEVLIKLAHKQAFYSIRCLMNEGLLSI